MSVRREAGLRQVPRVPKPRPVAPPPWPPEFLSYGGGLGRPSRAGHEALPTAHEWPEAPRPRAPRTGLPRPSPSMVPRPPRAGPTSPPRLAPRQPHPAEPRPACPRPQRQRLTRKRRALRPLARAGPGAGGRLGQAAPRTGPLGPGLWLRGPERWPPPAAPLRRTLQERAPTLRTARRVRSETLAAAHPPTTPAPPPPAAAVRSVNIPASPRRGRGGRRPRPPGRRPRPAPPAPPRAGLGSAYWATTLRPQRQSPNVPRWRPGGSWGAFLWSGPALVPSFRPLSLQIGRRLPFDNFKCPMFKRSAELVRHFLLDHRVFYPSLEDRGL